MEELNFFVSLTFSYDPDRDEPASLTAALEEIIGVWSPLGTSGYVRTFSIVSPSEEDGGSGF